jgi:hypothetical protein
MARRFRAFLVRLFGLLARGRREGDLAAELESHLQLHIDDNLRGGMTPDEARRHARLALGAVEQAKEQVRDARAAFFDPIRQDAVFALRLMRRSPVASCVAVVSLALGIGANTAIFTVVRSYLLGPLPYPHADRLVWVFETTPTYGHGDPVNAAEVTVDTWRQQSRTFDALGTFVTTRRILTGIGEAEELAVGAVSPDLFRLLGATAWGGRLFSASENRRGSDGVAVLSHAFWQRRFKASEGAFGRQIEIGGRPFTVVGVLPRDFGFVPLDRPRSALFAPKETDVWVPVSNESSGSKLQSYSRFYLGVIGRLRQGATPDRAERELSRIASTATKGRSGARVFGLHEELVKQIRTPLLLLAGAAIVVLLIVCANVAHLQLARGIARAPGGRHGPGHGVETGVMGGWRMMRDER